VTTGQTLESEGSQPASAITGFYFAFWGQLVPTDWEATGKSEVSAHVDGSWSGQTAWTFPGLPAGVSGLGSNVEHRSRCTSGVPPSIVLVTVIVIADLVPMCSCEIRRGEGLAPSHVRQLVMWKRV
jgi:hypothetical protein